MLARRIVAERMAQLQAAHDAAWRLYYGTETGRLAFTELSARIDELSVILRWLREAKESDESETVRCQ